jgi:hypothetical protein
LRGARAHIERAVAIGEAALGPDDPDMAILQGSLATVLQTLGTWKVPERRWSGR